MLGLRFADLSANKIITTYSQGGGVHFARFLRQPPHDFPASPRCLAGTKAKPDPDIPDAKAKPNPDIPYSQEHAPCAFARAFCSFP